MVTRSRKQTPKKTTKVSWPKSTELVGLEFLLVAQGDDELYPQYTIGLHAWFLQQIQQIDPALSAYLHDGESEKPFTITGLDGQFVAHSRALQLQTGKPYRWRVSALSQKTVAGIASWLPKLPETIVLKDVPFSIQQVKAALPATTYAKLAASAPSGNSLSLSFVSPTSFRRKGHHLPLPWPRNVFHSYLRRWNHFSGESIDQDAFLNWIDDHVIVQRHQIQSVKVAAGKRGSVTGFTGAVTYGLDRKAVEQPEFEHLFWVLGQFAPYCGTGHKTTFGLGETIAGWHLKQAEAYEVPSAQALLAERIEELTELFRSRRKRTGGNRAQDVAEIWATILARRELGDTLQAIADDLEMSYETTKTYGKLARRSLRETL